MSAVTGTAPAEAPRKPMSPEQVVRVAALLRPHLPAMRAAQVAAQVERDTAAKAGA